MPGQYEFQCLHGMGEPLYEQVVGAAAQGGWPALPHLRAGGHARDAARLPGAPAAGERRQHLVRQPHRRCRAAARKTWCATRSGRRRARWTARSACRTRRSRCRPRCYGAGRANSPASIWPARPSCWRWRRPSTRPRSDAGRPYPAGGRCRAGQPRGGDQPGRPQRPRRLHPRRHRRRGRDRARRRAGRRTGLGRHAARRARALRSKRRRRAAGARARRG
jgi:hypothetical protein